MDNLNTHKPGSLYEAFAAEKARRIAKRLEIHYTPKHGSWLNMAEIEIGVLSRQCLNRRIPDQDTLRAENMFNNASIFIRNHLLISYSSPLNKLLLKSINKQNKQGCEEFDIDRSKPGHFGLVEMFA